MHIKTYVHVYFMFAFLQVHVQRFMRKVLNLLLMSEDEELRWQIKTSFLGMKHVMLFPDVTKLVHFCCKLNLSSFDNFNIQRIKTHRIFNMM